MSFLNKQQIQKIKNRIEVSEDELKKIHRKSKDTEYIIKSIDINRLDEYIDKGWEIKKEYKTKAQIQKIKKFDKIFEDDIWSLFFKLGFNVFNSDSELHLPWSNKNTADTKQIDVLAADTKRQIIFIIECKSSKNPGTRKDFKDEFEHLRVKIDGHRKALNEVFASLYVDNPEIFDGEFNAKSWKIKHIFATRNIRIPSSSVNAKRLEMANSFHLDDNKYSYITDLIEKYKDAAIYQFLPLIFKGTKINDEKIKIPAVKSKMGGLDYYVFSIEPRFLLQIGYVLHRVKANIDNFPTYQRLLVPSRLNSIRKFLSEDKGFFPNSILLNFSTEENKIIFEPAKDQPEGVSKIGILKVPNVYAMAFIIDGQHRVYGYSGNEFSKKQSVPVVAFSDLESMQQLKIFMEINQNQKKISPSLRLDLVENLYWDSKYPNERMEALRSFIVKRLGSSQDSILYNKIEIGEDKAELQFKPFMDGLKRSGLLPTLKSKYFNREVSYASLYDFNLDDEKVEKAMDKAGNEVSKLLLGVFKLLESHFVDLAQFTDKTHMILSPRGIEALIAAVGSINIFLYEQGKFSVNISLENRLKIIEKYVLSIYEGVNAMNEKERQAVHASLGGGGATARYSYFLSLINNKYPDFSNEDLVDWKEKQDSTIQDKGRKLGEKVERHIKNKVLDNLKLLYGDEEWEWNIGDLRKKCMERHDEDTRRSKKSGDNQILDWWDYFDLTDYKRIMEMKGIWQKTPSIEENKPGFKTFSELFSINLEDPEHKPQRSKDGLKWLSDLIKYRNVWAHSGTKQKRINSSELQDIEVIATFFKIK